MIELRTVRPEDRELLWTLLQKYLHELTNYYDDEMDAAGNYGYRYFDAYFSDPARSALFLYDAQALVGFAMLHPYSHIGEHPDHVLAEFTVFPGYRRRRLAEQAAQALFRCCPGSWEIKYHEGNAAAKALWSKVTTPYRPRKRRIGDAETVLSFRVE